MTTAMTKFDIHSWEDIITPNKFAPLSNDWTHPRITNKKAAKALKLAEAKKLTEKTTAEQAEYLHQKDQNEELLRRGQRW